MPTIPECVAETQLVKMITNKLERVHQGKVRDTFSLPNGNLLVFATDRISIFDFVLPAVVLDKGRILTALSIFWLTKVLTDTPNHLVAFGDDIDAYLPTRISSLPNLKKRALVVKKQEMLPVECIVRGHLTGSGWKSYQRDGSVCGIQLPSGLHDGSKLPEPIFTPTTKAEIGHDEDLDSAAVIGQYGEELGQQSIAIYQTIAAHAAQRGIILADTKFEFGQGPTLADEVGTPDSSRFWDTDEWKTAAQQQQSPPPHDKQLVRNWGKEQGIHELDPDTAADLDQVNNLIVPTNILGQTTRTYHDIFERLTGKTLENFTHNTMGITSYN